MARPVQQFYYTFDDIVRLTGLERATVWQHQQRGHFDMERIETIGLYLARYGTPELRVRYMQEVLRQSHEAQPGIAKTAHAAKKAAKKPKPAV